MLYLFCTSVLQNDILFPVINPAVIWSVVEKNKLPEIRKLIFM